MNEKFPTPEQAQEKKYDYDHGLLEHHGKKELIIDRDASFSIKELKEILAMEFPGVPEDKIHITRIDYGEGLVIGVED